MSGTHRGKPDQSVLIALLAAIVVPVAAIGFIIYLGVMHLSGLWILVSVFDAVVVIRTAHRVVLNLASRQLQSAEEMVDRLSLIAQLIGAGTSGGRPPRAALPERRWHAHVGRSGSFAAIAVLLLPAAVASACDSPLAPSAGGVSQPTAGATVLGSAVPASAVLSAVAASSARNAWAVGYSGEGISSKTLALQWNGSRWTRVPSPAPGVRSGLTGVGATSARDAWAVGFAVKGTIEPLILRWNGTRWSRFPGPRPGPGGELESVSAISATDAWAVGTITARSIERVHSAPLPPQPGPHLGRRTFDALAYSKVAP